MEGQTVSVKEKSLRVTIDTNEWEMSTDSAIHYSMAEESSTTNGATPSIPTIKNVKQQNNCQIIHKILNDKLYKYI